MTGVSKMLMRSSTLLLLASVLLVSATAVDAQTDEIDAKPEPRRYNVEIILFRYADSVPSGNEQFVADPPPVVPSLPDGEGQQLDDDAINEVLEFGDLTEPPESDDVDAEISEPELGEVILPARHVELQVTARDALTLQAEYDKLELLDAYEPLLWTGWSQLAVEREVSPLIPLRRLGSPPLGFDGELQLYLSRFLHLVVDLTLTPRQQQSPDAFVPSFGDARSQFDAGLQESGVVKLRINEDRIFRNGDLRYFDHPKFGLLAKVTRIEPEVPAEPDSDGDGAVLPAGQ